MQQPNPDKLPPGRRGCLYVLMALLMGALMLYIVTKPRGIDPLKPQSIGPSASWSTMLAIAEREAYKIDKDALLDYTLSANTFRYPSTWVLTDSMEITFTFWRPLGDEIDVTFEDAAPASTLKISAGSASFRTMGQGIYDLLLRGKQGAEKNSEQIKLSPRQAVEKTWSEATNYAKEQGITNPAIKPVLVTCGPGKPVLWNIDYMITDSREPTPDPSKSYLGLNAIYDVDAQTGEIITREYNDNRNAPPVTMP